MSNVIKPSFTRQMLNLDPLPRKGWAGLISDTSLLNVDTARNDGTVSGSKYTRAGTVFVITGNSARGNLVGHTPVDAAGAAAGKRVGGVAFSHDGARFPEVDGVNRNDYGIDRPINVVTVGRMWMLAKSITGINFGDPVAVAAPRTTAGQELTGWVEKSSTDSLDGWIFTGLTETDDDGNLIAEVEINRA